MHTQHPEPQPRSDSSAWSQRYDVAIERYYGLDPYAQEAVAAVREGIAEWRDLLPQRAVAANGSPIPANTWGLGAERCVIQAIRSQLTATGQTDLGNCVWSQMEDLLTTAEALDSCYLQPTLDARAERRLLATAKVQANSLLRLLERIRLDGPSPATAPRHRKRVLPPKRDPSGDQRLFDEWQAARGKSGATRKEFCASKNISLQEFIQILDRVRKQRRQQKGWRQ